jgi:pyruvate dehydrogenase E2 component (dihydrolipoamide acetyltransferase)
MATEVKIPKLGLTMEEGTVAEWLVPDGAAVTAGQLVYRLETDKVETEIEAEGGGVLHQLVAEGTTLEPGAVVGWLLAEGETAPGGDGDGAGPASPGRVLASPNARRMAAELGVDLTALTGTGPGGRIVAEDVEAAAAREVPAEPSGTTEPAAVSPLVRRLAETRGVNLGAVAGTGPGGRITRADIEAAGAAADVGRAATGVQVAVAGPPSGPTERPEAVGSVPLTGMRRLIARRMHASLQEMAQLTLTMDVDMDAAVALRDDLRDQWADTDLVVPGYTDLVVKAVGLALAEHPRMNAEVRDDHIALLEEVNVGVAVALDDGLVVPVIRDAACLPLAELAAESSRLAEAARSRSLELVELEGGTFSVTALGMFGVDAFTPVINPPNVGILGVGRIRDEVRLTRKGRAKPTRRMTLSLTFDHRAVDGAPAAQFLQSVKALLESPLRLLT